MRQGGTYPIRGCVVALFLSFAQEFCGASDVLLDGDYSTACGPIACYVALSHVGVAASLPEVAEKCNWRKGETTTLREIRDALVGFESGDADRFTQILFGMRGIATLLSDEQLESEEVLLL